jgi:folate-binding protein YgfZ
VPRFLRELGVGSTEDGRLLSIEPAGVPVHCLPRSFGRLPCADLCFEPKDGERVLSALAHLATPAGEETLERARAEQGVPAYGAELDERVLPNEARLEDVLSWTKGCYPGQEPVVMAKHRGHPANLLVRLRFGASTPPPVGATLLSGGKPVGRVTTAVAAKDGPIGLGYVRWALVTSRHVLTVEGGGTAHIDPDL